MISPGDLRPVPLRRDRRRSLGGAGRALRLRPARHADAASSPTTSETGRMNTPGQPHRRAHRHRRRRARRQHGARSAARGRHRSRRWKATACEVLDRGNLAGPANPWLPPVDGYRHLRRGGGLEPRRARGGACRTGGWAACRSCSAATTAWASAASARWRATAARPARSCACCGSTPTPTSTPACSRPAATSTACRWPACAATGRRS